MSRRHSAETRVIIPDIKYNSELMTKFINALMYQGKKSIAERIFYGALEQAEKKSSRGAMDVFTEAMGNVRPTVEVRSRRVGGATYQVPMEVRTSRANALAMRWLIASARKRSERTMAEKLAAELLDALNNRGAAVKKRDDTTKMAEANRAFAHYRW